MNANNSTVALLQLILSGLQGGSQLHYLHAIINRRNGFTKLADRMMEEFDEETKAIETVSNRLLALGATPQVAPETFEVFTSVEEQLRNECQAQVEGIAQLEAAFRALTDLDVTTEIFLTEYIKDENEHAEWLIQQVNLIDQIGIQNYLAKQI
ncbi:MAG: hypothetical protein HUK09_00075 [Bacteroidaceae bacterium]|nr:hypothetical protein [Bacteroidaceae bacterium]